MDKFEQTLESVLNAYRMKEFVDKTISGEKVEISANGFFDFCKQENPEFYDALLNKGVEQGKSPSSFIYGSLQGDTRTAYGAIFMNADDYEEMELQERIIEEEILTSSTLQMYRRTVQPYLSEKQNKTMTERIAKLLFDKLTKEGKEKLTMGRIKTYILNLGFIRLPRTNHKEAVDFIIEYHSLFEGQEDVKYHIVERFMDEEILKMPRDPAATHDKICELKDLARKIYEQ